MSGRLLASDLDRTLLPNGNVPAEPDGLSRFREWALDRNGVEVIYVTGRHRGLAREALREFELPEPDWLICNVGTEIYSRGSSKPMAAWEEALSGGFRAEAVREWALSQLEGARLQEEEKQSPLKVSFYVDPERAQPSEQERLQEELAGAGQRARIIVSYDETEEVGLVDFLAPGSGKARALEFLRRHRSVPPGETLFAGDSGNDADALLSGVCGVLVGNATDAVREQMREALSEHPDGRVYFASRPYAAGVLEGMVHYGWLRGEP